MATGRSESSDSAPDQGRAPYVFSMGTLTPTVMKSPPHNSFSFSLFLLLKGTKRQYSGQMSQIFKTVKTIEIQPVRPTEVCGKL